MQDIFSKFFQHKNWLEWLVKILMVDYLLLFGMETILPGFVNGIFNLNYLLLAILGCLLVLIFLAKKIRSKELASSGASSSQRYLWLRLLWAGFFLFLLVIALYRASFWQIALYTILAILVERTIYHYLAKED